jgi:uncharacterized protein DUF6602
MKANKKKRGRNHLRESFVAAQQVLERQLELSTVSIPHGGVKGAVNEKHVIDMLRAYLPNRYQVRSAIVLDSDGNTSDQIDVVVFDEQYTPTILDQQDHQFVPAEAVYAVFEVKPTINRKYLLYAAQKAQSVRKLQRTSIAIHHAGGVFPPKQLFPIVAGIVGIDVEWEAGFGSAFLKTYRSLQNTQVLDCGLAVSGHCFDNYEPSASPRVFTGKGSLAYFLFRFLEKLQSLGTVPAVDWTRYARILSRKKR